TKEPADSWLTVSVHVSPDGKWLVSYHYEARVKHPRLGQHRMAIWDARTLKHVRDFPADLKPRGAVAFSPDSKSVTVVLVAKTTPTGRRTPVAEFALATGNELRRCEIPDITVGANLVLGPLTYSPDGNRVAISGGQAVPVSANALHLEGHVHIWDRTTGKVTRLPAHNPDDYFCTLTFSADGKKLFCGAQGTI